MPDGIKIEFHIIDGQQRLTTFTLLLLAICSMIRTSRITSDEDSLDDQKEHTIDALHGTLL